MTTSPQMELPLAAAVAPAAAWDRDVAKRALDELFSFAKRFRTGAEYRALIAFVGRFRTYSPYNAMLIHMQMPGARYVAAPHRWLRDYRREIRPGARPIVILQPRGPVMLVFDVSDTETLPGAPELPRAVTDPFAVRRGSLPAGIIGTTAANARRDGIRITEQDAGSQLAGSIGGTGPGRTVAFAYPARGGDKSASVTLRYEVLLNAKLTAEARYVTLAHELGHLYCGHLGTPERRWWPDRRGLPYAHREFEAESVCHLLCDRLEIDNPSEAYLAGYLDQHGEPPPVSLECITKAAGLIESMGRGRLKPRKVEPA